MIAFLPLVSASSGRSVRKERNSSAVSKAPVRITRSRRGSPTRVAPSSSSPTWISRSTSRGTPASHRHSAITAPHRSVRAAGFSRTADPAASAASAPPAGIATGKFHGGVTSASAEGTNVAPSTESSRSACSA